MFRNNEAHFAHVPQADIRRSVFHGTPTHTTSFNVGEVIPLYVDSDILPGDSVKCQVSKIVRLQTMIAPILGDLYLDTFWFFIPHRLVWSHWKEFMGENNTSSWVQPVQYQVPCISAPSGGFETGTLADYMGLPVGVDWNATDKLAPIALPFRAYALIMQEFFRSEDLTDSLNIPTGDANQTGTNGTGNYINDVANGGPPFIAAKIHDLFTSCLPSAQKAAAPVTFPLLSGTKAPVLTFNESVYGTANFSNPPITNIPSLVTYSGDISQTVKGFKRLSDNSGDVVLGSQNTFDNVVPYASSGIRPANLWADLS